MVCCFFPTTCLARMIIFVCSKLLMFSHVSCCYRSLHTCMIMLLSVAQHFSHHAAIMLLSVAPHFSDHRLHASCTYHAAISRLHALCTYHAAISRLHASCTAAISRSALACAQCRPARCGQRGQRSAERAYQVIGQQGLSMSLVVVVV